jgi:hypothetical protein
MNNKLWFRAKRFGWGWTPISWQGWVLTLVYIVSLVNYAFLINPQVNSGSDFLIRYAFFFIPVTTFFIIICYLKGEHPHWSWGNKK